MARAPRTPAPATTETAAPQATTPAATEPGAATADTAAATEAEVAQVYVVRSPVKWRRRFRPVGDVIDDMPADVAAPLLAGGELGEA